VVNQLRPGMFGGRNPAEQVRAALGRYVGIEPAAVVPYDRHGVDAGLLAGQALREARPGCPSQIALARLATALFPAQPVEPRRTRRRSRATGHATAITGARP
jgi:Flp pilus assembly CpaE family ATPase